MKKIIDTIQSNGGTAQVHQSLFVFLKFISSVVPTIEYDFTIDLELE
jgi:ubiquitin-like-conjugating enzyme ATG3